MDDREIISLFLQRSQQAISETAKKYGRYCHYIAYQILNHDEDAEEVVNDTYLKAWNTIPPKEPNPLKPYLGTISRNLALNTYEAQHAQKRGGEVPLVLEELAECVSGREDFVEELMLQQALNDFLSKLPAKCRKIFVRRYWYTSPISEIAADFGMSHSAVAMLLLRTRNNLKDYLESEGFTL